MYSLKQFETLLGLVARGASESECISYLRACGDDGDLQSGGEHNTLNPGQTWQGVLLGYVWECIGDFSAAGVDQRIF